MKRKVTTLLLCLACLLTVSGCKNAQTSAPPSNPFDDMLPNNADTNANGTQGSDTPSDPANTEDAGNTNTSVDRSPIGEFGRFFGASDYDASASHGEKKLYYDEVSDTINRTSYNGIIFEHADPNIFTYDISNPLKRRYLCFDPTCTHVYKEYCPSSLEGWFVNAEDPNIKYVSRFVVDSYDYETVPVIYMSFYRSEHYFVNGVMHDRESVYCIERFDMKTGQRTIVADNIDEIIDEMFTYGDYVYFTKVDTDNNHILCRIHKSGGEITTLDDVRLSYRVLDVVDDKIYYLADDRYICRTDLSLSECEQLADLADLATYNEYTGYYFYGARGGYIYYSTNVQMVYSTIYFDKEIPYELGLKMDLYRLPLNDLDAAPELMVKEMADGVFTDDTFFYCPAIYQERERSSNDYVELYSVSNGTILALDLNTLETSTVCENEGLNFFFKHAISAEDDVIGVVGHPYTDDALVLSGQTKKVYMGKKSGGGLEFWYTQGKYEYENRLE